MPEEKMMDKISPQLVEKMMREAFEEFNTKSQVLTNAYNHLKDEIARINNELENKNRELSSKNLALDQAHHFLNNLFQSMSGGLIVLDENNVILKLNPGILELLKMSEDNLLGKKLGSIKLMEPFHKFVESAKKSVSSHHNSACTINLNDDVLWIELSGSFVRGTDEFLLIVKDLTEVKDLRKQLVETATLRDLGQMAVTVAHEIRNPLGGIEGFASLLKRDLADNPDNLKLIEKIISGVRNLNSFIGCLLSFSKPLNFSPRKMNLGDVVRRAINYSGKGDELDKYPNITITEKISEIEIVSDPELIQQLVLNLILNAYQILSEEKGIVEINVLNSNEIDADFGVMANIKSLNYDESRAFSVIKVGDSGPGITQSQLGKIFEPFYTTKSFGTGVGLSMVHKIIEVLEGKIEVVGNGKLGGAVFLVHIPDLRIS